jgi:hypothetical protein
MIQVSIPGLPISTNVAYFTLTVGRGKHKITKRVLTKEGRAYKTETTAYIVQHYAQQLTIFKPNTPYGYIVQLCFPELVNKTYPEKAQTRYKKLDATNRSKLLEDAFSEAFGVDDSVFLSTRYDKVQGPEYTHIWVWNMEEECPYSGRSG